VGRVARSLLLAFAGALVLVLFVAAYAWRTLDEPGPSGSAVRVEIPPGTPLSRVAKRLEEAGVVRHPLLLEAWGRITGRASRVQAGEYAFPAGATSRQVMARLVSGEVVLHALTIVEGWTFRQLMTALGNHPAIAPGADSLDGQTVMARLGRPDMSPEGWFLPETYRFPRGAPPQAILEMAHGAMVEVLESAWADRAPGLPFDDPYQALILASIIEKETGLADERAAIAGVFVRRLARGMKLQTDPTVIYGLGEDYDGNLRRVHLETDGPFNTYMRTGLPPTPIALPGRAAVVAALQPAEGDALYFVATGEADGSHWFSATLEEHNRAVQRYLAKLRARRAGR
jgi:UPF0755 protein